MSESFENTPIDAHFAALMLRLNGRPDAALEAAAQAVSRWRAAGHICVPLAELGGENLEAKLRATRVVGVPGDFKPLILDDHGRLYFHRYWSYENALAGAVRARMQAAPPACDRPLLARGLEKFFKPEAKPDAQRLAAEMALTKRFCVITGGPGTGKTRTVVVVLALLIEQFAALGKTPRIALAAPTGKAGARLKESIHKTADALALSAETRARLPTEATTLHRLLGSLPDSPYFRHDAANPLAVDAVIVDEASMVDLALMAKLIAAIPDAARLILLGDKDQLASVDAGSVLADICQTPATATEAPIVELKTNFRFGNDSGIFRLSQAVNAGDAQTALAVLHSGEHADLVHQPSPTVSELPVKMRAIVERYRGFLTSKTPEEALRRLNDFRILCALRRGPFGVENINRLAELALTNAQLIDPARPFYTGRPVLILRNDPQLKIFNGDLGLLWPDPEIAGEMRAFFLDPAGALRRLLPARLPEHETAFAMTVHKSQGSEFDRVLLVLPERDTPVATRELVYTGLTRARRSVELWSGEAVLRGAIARRTQRISGLPEALWGGE